MSGVFWSLTMALVLMCPAWASASAASASFEQRLVEADRLRSFDRQRFTTLLDELDARRNGATPMQLQRLRYLRAYQALLYRNQPRLGIAQAQALFDEATEPDLKFRAGSLLVNSYAISRDFTQGLRYLNQTLPMRESVHDKDIRHDGIAAAAMLYKHLGQHKLSLRYAEEILADRPNPRAQCGADFTRLEAQFHLDALPADAAIDLDIDRCLAIGDGLAANFMRVVLAQKWAAMGEDDKAIMLLEKHLVDVDSLGYNVLIARVHALLAELKLRKGELAAAQRYADATIEEVEHFANSVYMVTAYKVLHEVAERQGQYEAALDFHRRYAEADKAHVADVRSRELAYEIVRHETLQKTRQIELLDQQNKVLQLQQRVQKQANQNMALVVVLLALLVAGVGYWAYKVKRLHLKLRRFAETDALTGVSNRHHFTQQAQRLLVQCAMASEPAALIMFDLDHFKAVNDTYGHDAGDWVLRHVAATSAGLCRGIDQFGRVGGKEFAILLHGCELNAAMRLAEDCRVRLSQTDTRDSGHTFPVTASFGVSATALSGYSLTSLMSDANLMLYRAKREGRNRVRGYRGDMPLASPQAVPPTSVEVPPMVADVFEPAQGPVSERLLERRTS